MPNPADTLRSIKTFEDLVVYLQDELDWPLEDYDFEDLTFEYAPAELGLKDEDAARVRTIRQLRPLVYDQPWGIFFVEFERKHMPVVVLRRILSHLVLKKRGSANRADAAAWETGDLLFISAFGDDGRGGEYGDQREIAFAHFHQEAGDLPTLRVLGWDGADTSLKLDHVARELSQRLCWPADPTDVDAWREQWAKAFRHRLGHVIRTSDALAERLAELARQIRGAALVLMAHESERGPLRQLHKAFQTALIHDLSEDSFADTYAQTVTYGLLTAAIQRTDPQGGRHDTTLYSDMLAEVVPITNPFLREMLQTFLQIGGQQGGINFDELGIQDVVELLRGDETDLPAILRDFGNKTRGEDPVIHFYEHFLAAYDKQLKVQRGIFYTPQPVVSYIVRSVHELLQTEFGLEDGLASTVTWGEMAQRHAGLKIPEGTKATAPFVVILDPATGTATFLVEVIDVIHKTMTAKWRAQRLTEAQQRDEWNEYVKDHLLPRLYGYELMMAPYAIAHMKIGLKLSETGYRFGSIERVRVYLTNALEPPDERGQLAFAGWTPALAHEAQAVNAIKRWQRFTVVVGNPPYASISANLTPELRRIVEPYRSVAGRRIVERSMLQFEKNIQDDYVKFLAFSQARLRDSQAGVCALITNHSYLDGPTLRGVRWNLISEYPKSWFLDLHGNTNKGERAPIGKANENVFDIKQGVSIAIFLQNSWTRTEPQVRVGEVWGTRREKYQWMASATQTQGASTIVTPQPPFFHLIAPDGSERIPEWEEWPAIVDIFTKRSTGTETGFDELMLGFTELEIMKKVEVFFDSDTSHSTIARMFDVTEGHAAGLFARRSGVGNITEDEYKPFQLRAYDYRYAFLRKSLLKTNSFNVMLDLSSDSPGLVTTRQTKEAFAAFAVASFCGHKIISSYDRAYVFPMFTIDQDSLIPLQASCVARHVLLHFSKVCEHASAPHDDEAKLTRVIFHYVLALLNAPSYSSQFGLRLTRDWPRVPLTTNHRLFRALAALGGELVSLHLMESPRLAEHITTWTGPALPVVEKPTYAGGTVWVDKAQTAGFRGVPEDIWNFHIGGYQVCEKWLKDRKGRVLSTEDIEHYQRVVVALHETIRIMGEIDAVIEEHGGWPIK